MTVLVTGIGGRIGRLTADLLRARGVAVRATSSRPERLGDLGFPVVAADLRRPESLRPALEGVDGLLLYSAGGPAEALTPVLREAGASDGLRRVAVVSSLSVEAPEMDAMAEHFVAVERAVEASGVSWTSLRGGYFATNTLAWAHELRATGTVSLPFPDSYAEPVHEADLADLAVAALTGDEHAGRAYPVTGPESLTQAAMAGLIGEVTGRSVTVRPVDPEEWQANVARHAPAGVAESLVAMMRAADGRPGRTDRTVAAARLMPRPFRTWVSDHAEDFTG
ncbi:uncharacterized protein YbjT (DUF2867 family) [Friedmanniella endophytica]|uniref:Uncharacterized protein YbjT (DUF2867 family) n=1 Tax=Microlunatus kandeliicorticis TaxID=1759536 RepID=A0A7W3ITY6_9ACTN|nr:NAD(P)H-binding protein [Microlunatus kandeliicorticis]MBA8795206.1 uncharacterized protein YbjT (DUF2867 family) [Microlunatus kandeliicorticis]